MFGETREEGGEAHHPLMEQGPAKDGIECHKTIPVLKAQV